MNTVAAEPLKRFEPKLTQTPLTPAPRTDSVLKVVGVKVKVTETFSGRGTPISGSLLTVN